MYKILNFVCLTLGFLISPESVWAAAGASVRFHKNPSPTETPKLVQAVDEKLGNAWGIQDGKVTVLFGDLLKNAKGEAHLMSWKEAFDRCVSLNSESERAQIGQIVHEGKHPSKGYYLPLDIDHRKRREAMGASPNTWDGEVPAGYDQKVVPGWISDSDIAEWSSTRVPGLLGLAYIFFPQDGRIDGLFWRQGIANARCARVQESPH